MRGAGGEGRRRAGSTEQDGRWGGRGVGWCRPGGGAVGWGGPGGGGTWRVSGPGWGGPCWGGPCCIVPCHCPRGGMPVGNMGPNCGVTVEKNKRV